MLNTIFFKVWKINNILMNASTKSRTSVAKFEEFFATTYKDDVFEILEKYPDERSLTVDYNDLEMFDPDLADLLIEKPEEVIEASKSAIKNIDPLVKDADINIRFENLSNIIPLKTLLSKYIICLLGYKADTRSILLKNMTSVPKNVIR